MLLSSLTMTPFSPAPSPALPLSTWEWPPGSPVKELRSPERVKSRKLFWVDHFISSSSLLSLFLLLSALSQPYSVITADAHVMLYNSVTVHCTVPTHMAELVSVLSWRVEEAGQAALDLSRSERYGSVVHRLHVGVDRQAGEDLVPSSSVTSRVTSSSDTRR